MANPTVKISSQGFLDPYAMVKERVKKFKNMARQGCSFQCMPEIFIVDDTEFNIYPVKLMLQEQFHIEPKTASNGKLALAMCKDLWAKPCKCHFRSFRLIIMDIGMPEMDGIQASDLILKMQQSESDLTHIVALTSFTTKQYVEKCKKAGIKEVYFKPLSLENLHQIMELHFFRLDN